MSTNKIYIMRDCFRFRRKPFTNIQGAFYGFGLAMITFPNHFLFVSMIISENGTRNRLPERPNTTKGSKISKTSEKHYQYYHYKVNKLGTN